MQRYYMPACLDHFGKEPANDENYFWMFARRLEGESFFAHGLCGAGRHYHCPLLCVGTPGSARIHHVSEWHLCQPKRELANRGDPGVNPPAALRSLYSVSARFTHHGRIAVCVAPMD